MSDFRRYITCPDCGGSGDRMPSSPGSCYLCGGEGEMVDESWCSLRGWVLVNDPAVCWVMWATEEGLCRDNGGVVSMTWNEVYHTRHFEVKPFPLFDAESMRRQRLRAFGFLRRLMEARKMLRQVMRERNYYQFMYVHEKVDLDSLKQSANEEIADMGKRIKLWVEAARRHLKNYRCADRDLSEAVRILREVHEIFEHDDTLCIEQAGQFVERFSKENK